MRKDWYETPEKNQIFTFLVFFKKNDFNIFFGFLRKLSLLRVLKNLYEKIHLFRFRRERKFLRKYPTD